MTPSISGFRAAIIVGACNLSIIANCQSLPSYTSNVHAALQPLREAAPAAAPGGGGVDIVFIGTSLSTGFSASDKFIQGWTHVLQRRFQEAHNPAGIRGGYGYVPCFDDRGATYNPSFITPSGSVYMGYGYTAVHFDILGSSSSIGTSSLQYRLGFADQDPDTNHLRVSDLEAVFTPYGSPYPPVALGQIDVQSASAAGVLPGDIRSVVVYNSQGDSSGSRIALRNLDRLAPFYVQETNGTAGFPFIVNGLVLYDGDFSGGYRFHNVSFPAGQTGNYDGGDQFITNIDKWCSGQAGAHNAKLFVIELGVNNLTGKQSPSDYQAQMEDIIRRIESRNTHPGILLIHAPVPAVGDGSYINNGYAVAYRQALTNIVANHPTTCGIVDLNAAYGDQLFWNSLTNNSYLSMLQPNGFAVNDLVHWTTSMQADVADKMYNILNADLFTANLSGQLTLQNWLGGATSTKLELRSGSSTQAFILPIAGDGTYNVTNVPTGTFEVVIGGGHWLKKSLGSMTISSSGAVLPSVSLVNGDIDGNNIININDYSILSDAFNLAASDPGYVLNADLDGNGVININDYAILSDNFNLTGD